MFCDSNLIFVLFLTVHVYGNTNMNKNNKMKKKIFIDSGDQIEEYDEPLKWYNQVSMPFRK